MVLDYRWNQRCSGVLLLVGSSSSIPSSTYRYWLGSIRLQARSFLDSYRLDDFWNKSTYRNSRYLGPQEGFTHPIPTSSVFFACVIVRNCGPVGHSGGFLGRLVGRILLCRCFTAHCGTSCTSMVTSQIHRSFTERVPQQSTFCINSIAHYLGSTPYDDRLSPRDHLLSALLTMGEGYHNFHHQFPMDYRNAYMWYQYDPTKVGLGWSLHSVFLTSQSGSSHFVEQLALQEIYRDFRVMKFRRVLLLCNWRLWRKLKIRSNGRLQLKKYQLSVGKHVSIIPYRKAYSNKFIQSKKSRNRAHSSSFAASFTMFRHLLNNILEALACLHKIQVTIWLLRFSEGFMPIRTLLITYDSFYCFALRRYLLKAHSY